MVGVPLPRIIALHATWAVAGKACGYWFCTAILYLSKNTTYSQRALQHSWGGCFNTRSE
jgi:hypothetical protein